MLLSFSQFFLNGCGCLVTYKYLINLAGYKDVVFMSLQPLTTMSHMHQAGCQPMKQRHGLKAPF